MKIILVSQCCRTFPDSMTTRVARSRGAFYVESRCDDTGAANQIVQRTGVRSVDA